MTIPGGPRGTHVGPAWRPHGRPAVRCAGAVVNPDAISQEGQVSSLHSVFFLSAVFQVMAHIMHTLSQSSVPPTLFQDSSSWCDLSSFEFFEEAEFSPSQHHAGRALKLQQREGSLNRPAGEPSTRVNALKLSEGSLDPLKPLPPSRHGTVPLVILRKKRGQASPLAAGGSSSFLFAGVSSSTPKRSPVKSLPFSPSQVEHDFYTAITNFQQILKP